MKHTLKLNVLSTLVAGASLTTAQTESSTPQELEPIKVTGTLWESDLQKTTASISVIDADSIKSSGSQHFGDLVNAIPNLTWTAGSSRPRYIQIRGIGENSQFEGETPDSSVRFLVDDLDFTGIGTIGNLFDVQQIEVLRGPQAGAFGVNAAGGIIKIVTNEPTSYWTGQAETTVGNDSLLAGGFAVGGPLLQDDPEQLTFRLSLYQLEQNGFRDNQFLNTDDTNERDEFNSRLKVRWKPNDDWEWNATVFYADADNGYDEFSLGNTEFNTFSDQPGRDEQESFATSIRGEWTGLDKVAITSITSYSDTNSLNSFDGDWTNPITTPLTYVGFAATTRERSRWSQELRFDSVDSEDALGFIDRWTAGIYFEDFSEDTTTTGFGDFSTVYETETIGLFGQATHILNEKTRITLGLRAEQYDLDTEIDFREDVDFSDTLYGGKLTVEYDLTADQTLFASATKGYKAGGANIYPFLEADVPTSYGTEDLWNYEIGVRSNWLDGAVISQATLFYLDRKDAQLRSSTGEGIDFTYATANLGDAKHLGAELEATWFINNNWALSGGLGLLDTKLDATGNDLSSAPAYTYNASIEFAYENGFFGNFGFTGSDDFFESNNQDNREQRIRSAFTVFNASIGYTYENWTVTLWGRNIFDERYEKRVFFFGNEGPNYEDRRYENPADPQQFGATLSYIW